MPTSLNQVSGFSQLLGVRLGKRVKGKGQMQLSSWLAYSTTVTLFCLSSPLVLTNPGWAQNSRPIIIPPVRPSISPPRRSLVPSLSLPVCSILPISTVELTTPTQVNSYIQQLQNRDVCIRRQAAYALSIIGDEVGDEAVSIAVPALIAALRDEDAQVRSSAAFALGRMGDEGLSIAVAALTAALRDEDTQVRRSAAYTLKSIGSPSAPALPALIEALQDEDKWVRVYTGFALGEIGEPAAPAVPQLITALQNQDADIRYSAAFALGKIGLKAAPAVPALTQALQAPETVVREYAALALGRIGEPARSAVPTLTTMLGDSYSGVRTRAAISLANFGEQETAALPILIEALQDRSEWYNRELLVLVAGALNNLASSVEKKADTLSQSELEQLQSSFKTVLQFVESGDSEIRSAFASTNIDNIRRTLNVLNQKT